MAENKAVAKTEKEIVYNVGGNEVKLSTSIVNQFITKGNGQLTPAEAVNFMMWCSHNKLDPFNNEAYLVKFGNQPAQQLVGKGAFMRRAEEDKNYEGFRAGVLILAKDGQILEREGTICLKTETLVGGWCEVHVKDKKYPVKATVSMDEYDKGQSTWKTMPATMIRKVAIVQAMREAFPTSLSSLYVAEEINHISDSDKNYATMDKDEFVKTRLEEITQQVRAEKKAKEEEIPFSEAPVQDAEIVED